MKLGICATPEHSSAVKKAGFDYIEPALAPVGMMSGAEFEKYAVSFALPSPAFNGFFDRNAHKLVGETVDFALLETFIRTALKRVAELGCKTAVLGSGYSRQVPDGFDRAKAVAQFEKVVLLAGKIAGEFGITIGIEPLNYKETNLLNTYAETAGFVREIGLDTVRAIADFYHIAQNGEGWDGLLNNADLLCHVHICNPTTRMLPKPGDGFDYGEFKRIFKQIGYDGRVSVEGIVQNWETDIPACAEALACLR